MEDRVVRTERIIAGARLVLAIAGINLLLLTTNDSTSESNESYTVVALYLLYAIAVVWVVDQNLMVVRRVGFFSQAIDTLWFPFILLYTHTDQSPFFLYYVFSLITASFRWGFKETLFVNTANVGMYAIVHFASLSDQFELGSFIVRPTYLYVLACLTGYLGEYQKRLQRQFLSLSELSQSISIKDPFSHMLEGLMQRTRSLFRVEKCVLVLHEKESNRFFLKKAGEEKRKARVMTELGASEAELLLGPQFNLGYFMNPRTKAARVFGLPSSYAYNFEYQKPVPTPVPSGERLLSILEGRSLLPAPIFFSDQFKGRIYLIDKVKGNFSFSDLQYLRLVVTHVGPLIENYRFLKQLQAISVLQEKSRIARDLHDGLLQSLASLDLRIEVCRKIARSTPEETGLELADLQRIVKSEHSALREYMKRLKSPSFVNSELIEALKNYVQVFMKETGLSVRLTVEPEKINLPRRIGREVYQVVREGLMNVKRHAQARQVLINLDQDKSVFRLLISDDGHGFPVDSETGQPVNQPWSIAERTRLLGGTLAVESHPGKGSTLFIRIPMTNSQESELDMLAQTRDGSRE